MDQCFIRLGKTIINLNHVTHVDEVKGGIVIYGNFPRTDGKLRTFSITAAHADEVMEKLAPYLIASIQGK